MYEQIFDPIGGSLALSSAFAALPLLTIFVLLGAVRMKAQWAALIALAVALIVAVAVYGMPVGQAFSSAAEGATFGIFPIMWIVVTAIWIYNMTVETGHFGVLRRSFGTVSSDQRVQAVIIAFCFGGLMEALAGFGTPVAISAVMLIALGFSPMKAATVALVANTAPVAFGAIAVPITTLAKITGIPVDDLASTVGRQTPILALFVPLVLVLIVDGRRGIRQCWLPAVVAGVVFAIGQFVSSNFLSVELTDIIASLAAAGALVILMRVWQPSEELTVERLSEDEMQDRISNAESSAHAVETGDRGRGTTAVSTRSGGVSGDGTPPNDSGRKVPRGASDGHDDRGDHPHDDADSKREVLKAYSPYLIIIAVFSLAQIGPIKTLLAKGAVTFPWPGLNIVTPAGKPPSGVTFAFGWLSAAGTLLLISGLITMAVLGLSPASALKAFGATLSQLKWAIVTVAAVLALAYVMNFSGQTITIGQWIAGTGSFFAFLSPVLGWLGVAVTGSDTSSNALFGTLQVAAAQKAGLSEVLLAAANSSGGVLGKMISPQNLAIAAAATGMAGKEGDLFRKVIGWSIGFLLLMCVLVYLQSTPVLAWMLP
ncbi:L-lactate permease [Mycobacterium antarcticum]|uniref:L-lactate permease n=1 Tax=unclassified Mycolicibacterium TaxID=2636767 RepID=UPI0023986FCE|nr:MULTISPECIES: L-lactate permease [unclassified Mycolicibacterium]BDX35220.1 L-lactate permease [Mycolicibacterium sp. TUM20985]GLP81482.1 L-lactate permease [Mycolicibacterium sp. TUM20984]